MEQRALDAWCLVLLSSLRRSCSTSTRLEQTMAGQNPGTAVVLPCIQDAVPACCWWAPTIPLHLRFPNHHPSNTWVWLNSPRHSGHEREEAGVADSDNRDNLSHPSILCVLAVHAAYDHGRTQIYILVNRLAFAAVGFGVRVILLKCISWTEWLQIPTKQYCTHIDQPPRQIRSLRRGHEEPMKTRRSVGGYTPPPKKLNPAT